jgi:hypothetical protein
MFDNLRKHSYTREISLKSYNTWLFVVDNLLNAFFKNMKSNI